ncbi:MAG TPA: hypothetical protein VNX88_22045 [Terriglobales bacterium]|jgi:hypothetical protein|nr:hypothetical protein [Terriglobales bacterium]
MKRSVKYILGHLLLAVACFAQDGLTVQSGRQKWPAVEAQKVYAAACLVVAQEYRVKGNLKPQVTLILGADKEDVWLQGHEIRLTKWNRYMFAQGVVMLALADAVSFDKRLEMTKRAVNWADATVEVGDVGRSVSSDNGRP